METLMIAETRMATLASELGLTKAMRDFADVRLADPTLSNSEVATKAGVPASRATALASHAKVRRYLDEALLIQRELAISSGKAPPVTQGEIMERMAQKARANLWDHVTFTDSPPEGPGYVMMPGGGVLNLQSLVKAGLAHLLKGITFDKSGLPEIEMADPAAADLALARWTGLERSNAPPEDDAAKEMREALRAVLMNPEHAQRLETVSIEIDRVRIERKAGK